jgi:hypothetical protein
LCCFTPHPTFTFALLLLGTAVLSSHSCSIVLWFASQLAGKAGVSRDDQEWGYRVMTFIFVTQHNIA